MQPVGFLVFMTTDALSSIHIFVRFRNFPHRLWSFVIYTSGTILKENRKEKKRKGAIGDVC